MASLCHPWFTTTNLSYRFPILKLPPPPCAVLLVWTFCFDAAKYWWAQALEAFFEGSLEVKLPTIWTDEKQSRAEAERRERLEESRSEKKKSEKKEDADARKGGKVAKHCVVPMIWGSGGSKSRLAKAAGAEPAGQMRDEKLHAVVARSTFRSENVQNTPCSDHFWKLRCRKSARRCGAKHISKWKCTKHLSVGPLLEVEMSKKCRPLWSEAHFEVKMYQTHQVRTTFGSWDVEKEYGVVARSIFRSENVKNTTCSRHFWRFRCRFASQAQRIVHLVKSEQNVRALQHFQKRWQAWGIWRSSKMHFAWQVQYKRHVHQRSSEVRALISWEGLHFGASDLQVCWDDFAWQVQHFVWPGINFSSQAQYFTQVEWKNRKTHWHEAPSAALNFPFLKEVSQNCFVFDVVKFKHWGNLAHLLRFWTLSGWKIKEVSQNCFVFDVVKFEKWGSLAEDLRFQSGR